MTMSLAVVNMATEKRREVEINRIDEYLEFTLMNGADRPVIIRQWLGDFTTWIGVDGYGQPGTHDSQATQVKLDVHHVGMTHEDKHYDSEMPPHPYVQVQRSFSEDDPPMLFLTNMRLLDRDEALELIDQLVKNFSSSEQSPRGVALTAIEEILNRVKFVEEK